MKTEALHNLDGMPVVAWGLSKKPPFLRSACQFIMLKMEIMSSH